MSSAAEWLSSGPLEIEPPKQKRQRKLVGERAVLDGFTLMEKAQSPNEYLSEIMNERIIDQTDAIDSIIDALDRSEVRLEGDNRPIANLAFLGPTGVGKSETAKVLHEQLGGPGKLIKIDCSAFAHGHEITSLTGSPPSYVGREQEPVLNKHAVEKPGTVILFDEIEKGSPELYHLMLQIMGDGELKLNNGEKTYFRDAIIILTSNLGAREMAAELSENRLGFAPVGERKNKASKAELNNVADKKFTEFFSPEFVNRLNKSVVFHPLSEDGLNRVLDVKLDDMNQEYELDYGVHISVSDIARLEMIGTSMKQSHMGARPLIRELEESIQSEFGRHIGSGTVSEGTRLNVFHRSEVPEKYLKGDDRKYIFAAQPDESLLHESVPVVVSVKEDGKVSPSHASLDVETLPRPYYNDTAEPIFFFAPTPPKTPKHRRPSISLVRSPKK